jgi:hypothetical protein
MQEIAFAPSLGNYDFYTTLGQTPVKLVVHWNAEDNDGEGAWYFDMYEVDGATPIASGLKITIGSFIGRACEHAIFSRGAILARDYSLQDLDPGFDDIGPGQRVRVFYLSADELVLGTDLEGA